MVQRPFVLGHKVKVAVVFWGVLAILNLLGAEAQTAFLGVAFLRVRGRVSVEKVGGKVGGQGRKEDRARKEGG